MNQKEEVEQLYKEFNEYVEHAEQHEFVMLAFIEAALLATLERFEENPNFTLSKEEERAMYRSVYRVIGDDREKDYLPDNEKANSLIN